MLVEKKSAELITPESFKLKLLLISQPGGGKTTWAAESPAPGFAACETGHGKGLLSVAHKNVSYVEPTSLSDFETISSGGVFKDRETIVIDSLSEMTKTFVKEAALKIPRTKGNSPKRSIGIPELDDYGSMGELTRRLLNRLLEQPKHIIVTALMRIKTPDAETGKGEYQIGPDLPGALFDASPAMFDFVWFIKTRSVLKDPKDAKSRTTQRVLLTQPDGVHIAKSRATASGKQILPGEIVIDRETGEGMFADVFGKILTGLRPA